MSDLTTLLEEALGHLDWLILIKYAGVAALTYLLLDVLETLEDEITLVWPSRLSAMKMIFFVNRYMPIVDVSIGTAIILGVRTHEACAVLWPLVTTLYAFGSFISEVILMVRTVALWNFNRIILGIMILNALIIVVPTAAVAQQYLRALDYPSTDVLEVTACVASISDGVGWVLYACIIVSETTVVALTLLKQYFATVRKTPLPLLFRTMYRDGTGFYILMLSISVANMLCMTIAPVWVSSALQLPHRAVHSTLCSRVLLNLRRAAAATSGLSLDDFNRRTQLAFERPMSCDDDSLITLSDLNTQ